MARQFNPREVREGDQLSAEWANEVRAGAIRDFDGIGPGSEDELGARYGQAADDGDMIELYEITSRMKLSEENECGEADPPGEWMQYYCEGRRIRPLPKVDGARAKNEYKLFDANEDKAVRLWLPTAFQEEFGGISTAYLHPSFAIGERVLVCQTFDHRWIVSGPSRFVRFELDEELFPCSSANAYLVDHRCDRYSICYGQKKAEPKKIPVTDTIDIFEGQNREFAPVGTIGFARWMPDAAEGSGQLEVVQIGGPCCPSSSESSESESSESESSSVPSSEESSSETCILCFDGVCLEDIPIGVIKYVYGEDANGCLVKEAVVDCEESESESSS
jgi:hypothetical protein